MAYPVFQSQGPTVDVQLFGQAAQQGAQLGKEIPNTFTSIIQGAESGYKQGVDIAAKQQQIEQSKAETRLKNIAAANAEATQQLQIDDTTARLQYDTAEKVDKLDNLNKQNSLEDTWSTLNPLQQKQLFFSGKIDSELAANPAFAKQALKTIGPYLNENEQQAAAYSLGKINLSTYEDHLAQRDLQKASEAQASLFKDGSYAGAVAESGLPPGLAAQRITAEPAGLYQFDPVSKNVILDDKTKKPAENELDSSHPPAAYDLALRDADGNVVKILRTGVSPATHNLMGVASHLNASATGRYKQDALTQYDADWQRKIQAQNSGAGTNAAIPIFGEQQSSETSKPSPQKEELGVTTDKVSPNYSYAQNIQRVPVVTPDGNVNLTNNNKAYLVAKGTLGLPDKDFMEIKPQVTSIFQVLEAKPGGDFGQPDDIQIKQLDTSKKNIAKFTAEKEWDTNPEIQKTITDANVSEHNANVDQFHYTMHDPFLASYNAYNITGKFGGEDINQMVKVDSPKDLYALRKGQFYQGLLDQMIKQYQNQIIQTKKTLLRRGNLSGALIASQN